MNQSSRHTAPSLRTLLRAAAVILIAAAATACSSQRRATTAADNAGTTAPAATAPATPADAYETLTSGYSDWTDVYMPVRVELDAPMPFSMSGRATMVRDRSVLISMRMLGIEVAALCIDGDNVYVADKYHRYLFADKLSALLGGYPLTVGNIQDILLGRVCYPGRGTATEAMKRLFAITAEAGMTVLSPRDATKGFSWHFDVSDTPDVALSRLTVTPEGRGDVTVGFSDPASTPAGTVSATMSVDATVRAKPVRASLTWNLGQARWNTGRTVDWRPPTGYTELSKTNILNIFKF